MAVSPKNKESTAKSCIHPEPVSPASRPHPGYLTYPVLVGSFLACLSSCGRNSPWCVHPDPKGWPWLFLRCLWGGSAHVGRLGYYACAHETPRGAGQLSRRSREAAMGGGPGGALPQLPCSSRNVEESESPNFRFPGILGR